MLKIAHVVTSYLSTLTILDSKLRALNSYEDIDLTVISSSPQAEQTRRPAGRHITVPMSRSIRPLKDLKSIYHLYKVFRKERFDVVHSHTAKAGFIAAVAAWCARVPLIVHTYHGLPFFQGQNKKSHCLFYFLEKAACRLRDYVFTQNNHDMAECAKLIGRPDKAIFESNGVDVNFIKQSAVEQLPQALKYFPGKGLNLVLISRLEAVKRVEVFFEVVSILKGKGLEVSGVVAGEGYLDAELREKLSEMKLETSVNMIGFTEQPYGLIAASDIMVLCSEKEGIPRSVMEAMALQKPVVATDVLGTQEVVEDGETGFLTPLGDTKAMAEKIYMLSNSPKLMEQMGASGKKRVEEYFNDIKIAAFLHDFYHNEEKNDVRS